MEDILKELLDTELQAEAMVKDAEHRAEQMIREARAQAQAVEQGFSERLPALYQAHVQKIDERAAQTIAELRRRYDERRNELRAVAEAHEQEAIEAALAVLTDPGRE